METKRTTYYTDSLEDAINTAVEMARSRDVVQSVDETVATERIPASKCLAPRNKTGTRGSATKW